MPIKNHSPRSRDRNETNLIRLRSCAIALALDELYLDQTHEKRDECQENDRTKSEDAPGGLAPRRRT
jgi:hypothetical protein